MIAITVSFVCYEQIVRLILCEEEWIMLDGMEKFVGLRLTDEAV